MSAANNQAELDGRYTCAITRHALYRMEQRNKSQREVAYVMRNGQLLHRTGICFYFLAAKDVPIADRKLGWVHRLIGTTVLASSNQAAIITLYKNQKGLLDIKKKNKFRSSTF